MPENKDNKIFYWSWSSPEVKFLVLRLPKKLDLWRTPLQKKVATLASMSFFHPSTMFSIKGLLAVECCSWPIKFWNSPRIHDRWTSPPQCKVVPIHLTRQLVNPIRARYMSAASLSCPRIIIPWGENIAVCYIIACRVFFSKWFDFIISTQGPKLVYKAPLEMN